MIHRGCLPFLGFVLDAFDSPVGTSKTRLLNILIQLRKCVNHPYLFDGKYFFRQMLLWELRFEVFPSVLANCFLRSLYELNFCHSDSCLSFSFY